MFISINLIDFAMLIENMQKDLISDNRLKRYVVTNIALPKRLLENIGRTVQFMGKIIRYSESASKSALGRYNDT